MTTVAWKTCQYGHELNATNTYVTPDGRRRCRTCKRDSDTRTRAARKASARAHDKPVRTYPHKYKEWARQTWALMSESDRMLVRHALANLHLEETPAQWTTTPSPPNDDSGSPSERERPDSRRATSQTGRLTRHREASLSENNQRDNLASQGRP